MPQLLQIHEPGATPEPGADESSIAVGIDLGTTNSVVAVSRDGAAAVIRDEDGSSLVPSVVAYAADGSAIVGELARRLLLGPAGSGGELDQAADGPWRRRPQGARRYAAV